MMYTRGYKVWGRYGRELLMLVLQVGGGKMRLLKPRYARFGCDVLLEFSRPYVQLASRDLHWEYGLFSREVPYWFVTIYDASGIVELRCMNEGEARAIKRYAERMAQRREKRKGRA